MEGIEQDYVKIAYAGSDVLYVPATQLDLVSKYIGGGEDANETKKLNRLGSFISGYSNPLESPPTVMIICPGWGRALSWKSTEALIFCSRRRVCRSMARCSPDTSTRAAKPLFW